MDWKTRLAIVFKSIPVNLLKVLLAYIVPILNIMLLLVLEEKLTISIFLLVLSVT